ncbi:MAG: hypothetical protein GY863_15100, partial [bacterium]|nr:hypothetical protein [bacterium]
ELDIPANSSPDIDRPLLMGNLSTTFLLKGKPEEIYDRTIEMIRSSASPIIPSTSCDVPMNTPHENIQAMLRAVRDIRSGSYL